MKLSKDLNSSVKYTLLVMLILCHSSLLWGQKYKVDEVRSYYYNVNLAELSILDSNYKEASLYYTEAFATGVVFPIDVYNAFRVSLLQQDTFLCIQYLNKMFSWGLDLIKFKLFISSADSNKVIIHDRELNDTSFFKYIEQDYEHIRKEYLLTNKPNLVEKLNSILLEDQNCRKKYGLKKQKETENKEEKDILIDSLHYCDNNVLNLVYSYVDSFGFPDVNKVGIAEQGYGYGRIENCFDIVLWHRRNLKDERTHNLYYRAVLNGEYDVRKFVRYTDFAENKYCVFIKPQAITKIQLENINKKRAEIFLEPLEDYFRKIQYQKKHGFNHAFTLVNLFSFSFNFVQSLNIVE